MNKKEHDKTWSDYLVEFFHMAKQIMLEFGLFLSALLYIIHLIEQSPEEYGFVKITLLVVLLLLLTSMIIFKILPSIRKNKELQLRPTGPADSGYFSTAPLTTDTFGFLAKLRYIC